MMVAIVEEIADLAWREANERVLESRVECQPVRRPSGPGLQQHRCRAQQVLRFIRPLLRRLEHGPDPEIDPDDEEHGHRERDSPARRTDPTVRSGGLTRMWRFARDASGREEQDE